MTDKNELRRYHAAIWDEPLVMELGHRITVNFENAGKLLESLAFSSEDKRWQLLARCHLWLLRIQQNRLNDADSIFISLRNTFEFEQLASLVPEHLRRRA